MISPNDLPGNVDPAGGAPFLRGNFFAEGEFIKTNVHTGAAFNRAGTRMCALSKDFLLGLREAIRYECGPAATEVLKRTGLRWGERFAGRLGKELSSHYGLDLTEFPMAMFLACLREAFSHHGWGLLTLDLSAHHHGLIQASIEHPIMGSILRAEHGQADGPADELLAGILAGMFTQLAGQRLDCVQTQCVARGATEARFVITLPERLQPVAQLVAAGKSHDEILAHLIDPTAGSEPTERVALFDD